MISHQPRRNVLQHVMGEILIPFSTQLPMCNTFDFQHVQNTEELWIIHTQCTSRCIKHLNCGQKENSRVPASTVYCKTLLSLPMSCLSSTTAVKGYKKNNPPPPDPTKKKKWSAYWQPLDNWVIKKNDRRRWNHDQVIIVCESAARRGYSSALQSLNFQPLSHGSNASE